MGARKSENIFEIETGVAIALCVKVLHWRVSSCDVKYVEFAGPATDKLQALASRSASSIPGWKECSADGDVFLPRGSSDYMSWPKLTDLFPWQHSGSQFKRLWPIAELRMVLEERWRALTSLSARKRANAFIETRDRVVSSTPPGSGSKKYTGIVDLKKGAALPQIVRYCYRSLDRQWCLADERLADFLRPSLVRTLGPHQVFAATLMSKTLGEGPAVTVTSCLPDMDVFCNRGAKDVIPLWRDLGTKHANVTRGLLNLLELVLALRCVQRIFLLLRGDASQPIVCLILCRRAG